MKRKELRMFVCDVGGERGHRCDRRVLGRMYRVVRLNTAKRRRRASGYRRGASLTESHEMRPRQALSFQSFFSPLSLFPSPSSALFHDYYYIIIILFVTKRHGPVALGRASSFASTQSASPSRSLG